MNVQVKNKNHSATKDIPLRLTRQHRASALPVPGGNGLETSWHPELLNLFLPYFPQQHSCVSLELCELF